MTRKCSHCGHNGHNSRTCPHRDRDRGGVKIFGVRLTDGPIRKSASMGNLVAMNVNGGSCNNFTCSSSNLAHDGYLSDGLVQESSSPTARERKKGVPWSEEEHRMFLVGLQKLGKGDWRGIARNFVITRTPTQVASHAQKFFIRQTNMTRRKRRSSLFDIVAEPDSAVATAGVEELSQVPTVDSALENCAKMQMSSVAGASSGNSSQNQDSSAGHAVTETSNQVPPQPNGAHPLYNQAAIPETSHMMFLPTNPMPTQEYESMVSTGNAGEEAVFPQFPAMVPVPCGIPVMMPGFMSPMVPFPVPVWPGFRPNRMEFPPNCNILKPTAKVLTAPLSIDEETGISKLSIGDSPAPIQPSDLSLKLLNRSSSESAFHANPAVSSNSLNSNSNAIHVN